MKIDLMQLEFIDLKLRHMAIETENSFRVEFEVTSLLRIDDPGNHGQLPLRAIDLGCRHEAIGRAVEEYVNSHWSYDHTRPEKKCCLYHRVKGGEWHLHLQVHPNTVRLV